jgi:aminoglycoside 6'-N-acetyltransferase I
MGAEVETCTLKTLAEWARLRRELWPRDSYDDHLQDAEALLARPHDTVAFLARGSLGSIAGFAEARLRRDYVNGCETTPVAFLEGIYVQPQWRRQGIARLLCERVEQWAKGLGVSELASDALLDNTGSQAMHTRLGFEETERVVYYRKWITCESPAVSQ